MVLNKIWSFFIIAAFLFGTFQFFNGKEDIFAGMMTALFDSAKTGFELSLGLTGVMCLWLGLMKIAEKAGLIEMLTKAVSPVFRHFFPSVPHGHPSVGYIMLNFSANMLGLDNAATPLGLKAMSALQELNEDKETASDAQIMFLVLNTSGLTLIPVSILVYRTQLGAANPADIFFPILIATSFSTLAGLAATAFFQKINIFKPFFLYLSLATGAILGGTIWLLTQLSQADLQKYSGTFSQFLLLFIITVFVAAALRKKNNAYEHFIEGAKDGFQTAVMIIPYLIAILAAVGIFRASGAMELMTNFIKEIFAFFNLNTSIADALPTAMMKPLSGSGARGLMIDAMKQFGADSFTGRLVCTIQGSTDTTFYILAVMFGSVGVRKTRHAVICGLTADFFGILAAVILCGIFFA
jgi:spore maturation protein SpmA